MGDVKELTEMVDKQIEQLAKKARSQRQHAYWMTVLSFVFAVPFLFDDLRLFTVAGWVIAVSLAVCGFAAITGFIESIESNLTRNRYVAERARRREAFTTVDRNAHAHAPPDDTQ